MRTSYAYDPSSRRTKARSSTTLPSLGYIHLMDVPHVLDHLVSSHESISALSMAIRLLAVDQLNGRFQMDSIDVPLEIRLALEELALARAGLVEAVELCAITVSVSLAQSLDKSHAVP